MKKIILIFILILLPSCSSINNYIGKLKGYQYVERYDNNMIEQYDKLCRIIFKNQDNYLNKIKNLDFNGFIDISLIDVYMNTSKTDKYKNQDLKLCYSNFIKVIYNNQIISCHDSNVLVYKIGETDKKLLFRITQNYSDDPIIIVVGIVNKKSCNYKSWKSSRPSYSE